MTISGYVDPIFRKIQKPGLSKTVYLLFFVIFIVVVATFGYYVWQKKDNGRLEEPGWELKYQLHVNGNVIDGGTPTDCIEGPKVVLDVAKHDTNVLAYYLNVFRLPRPPGDLTNLRIRKEAHKTLETFFTTASCTIRMTPSDTRADTMNTDGQVIAGGITAKKEFEINNRIDEVKRSLNGKGEIPTISFTPGLRQELLSIENNSITPGEVALVVLVVVILVTGIIFLVYKHPQLPKSSLMILIVIGIILTGIITTVILVQYRQNIRKRAQEYTGPVDSRGEACGGGAGCVRDDSRENLEAADGAIREGTTDPATGRLIDPVTGYLYDPQTGQVIDPRTGTVLNPNEPIDYYGASGNSPCGYAGCVGVGTQPSDRQGLEVPLPSPTLTPFTSPLTPTRFIPTLTPRPSNTPPPIGGPSPSLTPLPTATPTPPLAFFTPTPSLPPGVTPTASPAPTQIPSVTSLPQKTSAPTSVPPAVPPVPQAGNMIPLLASAAVAVVMFFIGFAL